MYRFKKKYSFYLEKIQKELVSPSRNYTYFIVIISQIFRVISSALNRINSKKHTIIWDVRSNGITFDFIYTIFEAYYRFNCPKNGLNLILFIPKNYDFNVFKFKAYDQTLKSNQLRKRIKDLILPLAKSFLCIKKILIESDEKELNKLIKDSKVFPAFYDPNKFRPNPLSYLYVHR